MPFYMKRVLIVASILTLLSVGALGCQRKAEEGDKKAMKETTQTKKESKDSQTATQKATVEVVDEDPQN